MKEYCGQPDFTHTVGRLVGWLVGWLVGPSAVNILIREVRGSKAAVIRLFFKV